MHKHIHLRTWVGLVASGDHAILEAFKHIKSQGISTIITLDQGGWLTYKPYAKKSGLDIIELTTDNGILNPSDLPTVTNAALIINSLPGYHAPQPMSRISDACTTKNILLINDASGSIGTPESTYGDIILGSFGKDKPVNAHYGGFITCETPIFIEDSFDTQTPKITGTALDTLGKRELIEQHLEKLDSRLAFLHKTHNKIKTDLSDYDIIHPKLQGINVIIAYHSDKEKQDIEQYCAEHKYQVTYCPREIRILSPAISIEVKRLVQE